MRPIDKIERSGQKFFIDRFHALFVQRSRILNFSIGKAVDYTAGAKSFPKLRNLWIIRMFRFLFRVQVVEVAKEFVKAPTNRMVFGVRSQVPLAD